MHRHIPNMLTMARLVLAVAFFVVLNCYRYEGPNDPQTTLLVVAFVLFIVAAITDALDGYLARRWNAVTLFGRVMDPVCDKILVVGAFVYLAGPRFVDPVSPTELISGIYPWMVVVILLRELLVTSIRAAMEGQGIAFGAVWAGKWKMILQVVAIPVVLAAIWLNPAERYWVQWTRDIFVWSTVAITIISGLPYITGAIKTVKSGKQ